MIINNVVLAGRLAADAVIIECQERNGRFKIDFRMAVNAARRSGESSSQGDKTTFISVKLFVSERSAEFFSKMLYKGREVVVTGSLASNTALGGNGTSSTFYYVDAKTVEVVPEATESRQEQSPAAAPEQAPSKPEPRQFHVQRPGSMPSPAPVQQQSETRAPVRQSAPQHHDATPAQLYRDKGVNHQPVMESNAEDLMRW